MKKRLQIILAAAGIASRRGAEDIIASGAVKVDGKTVTEKGMKVDPDEQAVTVYGKKLPEGERKRYFLLNKPAGYITTAKDTHSRRTVVDLFKGVVEERVYPVGRLDKDTTGVLIVTNDGDLANKLAHPRYMVYKEYVAEVKDIPDEARIKKLERGVNIDGRRTAPCTIKLIKRGPSISVFQIILHEGKKRQIKRMFEVAGGKVSRLERTVYAGLTLGSLKEGMFRELNGREVSKLKKLFDDEARHGS